MTPTRAILQADDGTYAVALIEYDGLESEDQATRLADHLTRCECESVDDMGGFAFNPEVND